MGDVNYLMKPLYSREKVTRLICLRTPGAQQEITWVQIKDYRHWTHPDLYQQYTLEQLYKTPYQTLRSWNTVFDSISLMCPPFAWQSNNSLAFSFTQNLVSEIQFGVLAEELSFSSSTKWVNIVKLIESLYGRSEVTPRSGSREQNPSLAESALKPYIVGQVYFTLPYRITQLQNGNNFLLKESLLGC